MADQQQTATTPATKTPKTLKLSVPTITAVLKRAGFAQAQRLDYFIVRPGFAVSGYGFTGRYADRDGGRAWITHYSKDSRRYQAPTEAELADLRNRDQWAFACYAAALLVAGYRLVPEVVYTGGPTFDIKLPLPQEN